MLAQLYAALLDGSKVTRIQNLSYIEFKFGIHLSEKVEILEFALTGVKWSLLGKKWH